MQTYVILIAIIITTVVGDYLIKLASGHSAGLASHYFVLGAVVYGSTAVGFFFMMQTNSLAQVGILYSAATIVLMSALGFLVFGEKLGLREALGIALAMAAIVLVGE